MSTEELLQKMEEMGCDIKGALARFLDDKDLYTTCLVKVIEDPAFDKLGTALTNEDAEEGFTQAHTLKGVIANMGITPIYNIVVEIVEPLRAGNATGLMEAYERLMAEKEIFAKLIMEADA